MTNWVTLHLMVAPRLRSVTYLSLHSIHPNLDGLPARSTARRASRFCPARRNFLRTCTRRANQRVGCRVPCQKIFCFVFTPNQIYIAAHPVPPRGALRTSRTLGRDAVDAGRALDESVASRTAKSCGPDAPTLASSWRQCLRIALTMVANKPGHQGEREGNR
jgi:hypothetical protein